MVEPVSFRKPATLTREAFGKAFIERLKEKLGIDFSDTEDAGFLFRAGRSDENSPERKIDRALMDIESSAWPYIHEQLTALDKRFSVDEEVLKEEFSEITAGINTLIELHIIENHKPVDDKQTRALLDETLRETSLALFKTNIFSSPSPQR